MYVHLALLALIAEARLPDLKAEFGKISGMTDSRTALNRAHYLGEQLIGVCRSELGEAGKKLTEWLRTILAELDPSPPPKNAQLHLLLDLYSRESGDVALALRSRPPSNHKLSRLLTPLADEDIKMARKLLADVAAPKSLNKFDSSINKIPPNDRGRELPAVRKLIERSIIESSKDGYTLISSIERRDLSEDVKEMVHCSSGKLYCALNDIPLAVAAAKQRAKRMEFRVSCHDRVGQLLTVLSAGVPSNGRILEIGTGVGVGTAWLAAGIDGRTDVELVSIELERELARSALTWPWPDNVKIENRDALDYMGEAGSFDLIFLDASPIKFEHFDQALKSLRRSGVMVMDDVVADDETPDETKDKIETLRSIVKYHPNLHSVEIPEASGVILATLIN